MSWLARTRSSGKNPNIIFSRRFLEHLVRQIVVRCWRGLYGLSWLTVLCVIPMTRGTAAEELRVFAAGSLKEVVGELGKRYEAATGSTVSAEFGPSGLMRERIEKGEQVDLFASADMGHPLKLL